MAQKDEYIYEIVYRSGRVKYGRYKVLKNVLGHQSFWNQLQAIGRARMPEFTDCTDEFLEVNNPGER